MANHPHMSGAGMPVTSAPGAHFPGPPGFHIPGQPVETHPDQLDVRPGAKEVKHLNQYTGYFTTPEGDFPVSVVADSIKEAAKILTMPGVFGDGITEPTTIKFIKGKIAVTIPVRMTGFNVVIDPAEAVDSGAHATPAHAEVKNGTQVLFTAHEPFGWKFVGWYKGDQLLSTEKVSWIEVYDPYSSLLEYVAKYEFDPVLRNGRYLELGHGWHADFKFDGWSNFEGRVILYTYTNPDWHFVISSYDQANGEITLIPDPAVTQGEDNKGDGIGMTLKLTPTPIGFNLVIMNISMDNPFGLAADQMLSLKWVGDHSKTYLSYTGKIK